MLILAIVVCLYLGLILGAMLRFMAYLMDKNHEYQRELTQATTDRVIVVVQETAKAVSEAIAPPAPQYDVPYETQPNSDAPIQAKEFEEVPWFLRKDGGFGVDPTDELDPWLTGDSGDVGRVASIRPGESIVPGPGTDTNLPGMSRPNMAGENY